MAWMTIPSPLSKNENDDLEQASLGVEAEPQVAMRPLLLVYRFDP